MDKAKEMYQKYVKSNAKGNPVSFERFCELLKSSKDFCLSWL